MTLALALAGMLAAATPEAAEAPEAPRLEVETAGGARRRTLHVQGDVREPVSVRFEAGAVDVLVLAGGTDQEPGPVRLLRLRADSVETLREDLPGQTAGLLPVDVDGDTREDLALFVPGKVLLLRAGPEGRYAGPLATLVADDDLDLAPHDFEPPGSVQFEASRLCTAVLGAVRCWSGSAAALPWARSVEAPLPISLARGREGLRLTGTPVQRFPGSEVAFAGGPVAEGSERLRVLLIAPGKPEESRTTECWVRLPEPERVLEHAFLLLDGEPALAVTTIAAGSFTLFGEKRLRLFALGPDRTRTGHSPLLAVSSSMNIWQQAHFFTGDVDADGRDDLVLGFWKGLKDSRVVLESWLRRPDGTFSPGGPGAAFDVEDGNRSTLRWGTDADGDGRPDLLLLAGSALHVYPGKDGKALVSRTPTHRIPVGEDREAEGGAAELSISSDGRSTFSPGTPSEGRIRPVDLDGDGRPEWHVGPGLTLIHLPR